jgi:hypothetical protein
MNPTMAVRLVSTQLSNKLGRNFLTQIHNLYLKKGKAPWFYLEAP